MSTNPRAVGDTPAHGQEARGGRATAHSPNRTPSLNVLLGIYGTRERAYEARKARFISENENATPAEYSAAMTRIARECGL